MMASKFATRQEVYDACVTMEGTLSPSIVSAAGKAVCCKGPCTPDVVWGFFVLFFLLLVGFFVVLKLHFRNTLIIFGEFYQRQICSIKNCTKYKYLIKMHCLPFQTAGLP